MTPDGGWTAAFEEAAVFTSHGQAQVAAAQLRLREVELYHLMNRYRTSEFDYTLSLA